PVRARGEGVQHRAGIPAERPVMRAGRPVLEVRVDPLPARDTRAGALAGRSEMAADLGVDLRDRLRLAAGGPHRVIAEAKRYLLILSLGSEDPLRLVGLEHPGLVDLPVQP